MRRILFVLGFAAVLAGCSAGASGTNFVPATTQAHAVKPMDNGGGPSGTAATAKP